MPILRMNRLSHSGLLAVALLILLSGCRSSSDVISDRGVQKRKYRSGFYVAKRSTQTVRKNEASASDNTTEETLSPSSNQPLEIDPVQMDRPQLPITLDARTADSSIEVEPAEATLSELASHDHPTASSTAQSQVVTSGDRKLQTEANLKRNTNQNLLAAKPTYSKNTGRIGLILFILGLVLSILSAALFGSFSLSASAATSAGLAVASSILGWLMMTVGIVMMVVHLVRLVLGA